MSDLSKELELAKQAALEAGAAIAKYYGQTLNVTHKSPDQPLTQADLAANKIIRETLCGNFPNDGWLSEEDADNDLRFTKKRQWIIDPLDGTRDFINHNPEFAISIALVENGKPILGVVYNPITKELFSATKGGGAFSSNAPLKVRPYQAGHKINLFVSQSEYKRGEWAKFSDKFNIKPMGGCAYKMSRIARGDVDGTFTLSPKSEWDICAGHLIVEEAGGVVTLLDGSSLTYNQPIPRLEGLIYCSGESVLKEILAAI